MACGLTVRSIRSVAAQVPMTHTLGASAGAVREAPLLLVDLETEECVTRRSYRLRLRPAAAFALRIPPDEPLRIVDGLAVAADGPGNGLGREERVLARYPVG
jgi:mandelate racemase